MILFFIVNISIVLAGFAIVLGHIGLANKLLNGTFVFIFLAILMYIIRLINRKELKKELN